MRLAVAQMRRWVDGERAWLAAHPIEGCYESAGRKFAGAIDTMSTSADWFGAIAEASAAPSDDVSLPSARTEAGQSLQDAGRALLDAAALAKVARTTCR
jgi:hypothetical protein